MAFRQQQKTIRFAHHMESWPEKKAVLTKVTEARVQDFEALADVLKTLMCVQMGAECRPPEIVGLTRAVQQGWKSESFRGGPAEFFSCLLPGIAKLALQAERLFAKDSLILLPEGIEQHVTISRQQAACLLAHAFFGMHVDQDHDHMNGRLTFERWYSAHGAHSKVEKIRCLLCYFCAVTCTMPRGEITFYRRVARDGTAASFDRWLQDRTPLTPFELRDGGIENGGRGAVRSTSRTSTSAAAC